MPISNQYLFANVITKKSEHLYSALYGIQTTLKRSGMDHTVLPVINTIPAVYLVSVHQMAPTQIEVQTSNCSSLLIYRPRKDERLSWPSWLISSGRFTHIVVTR